MGKTAVAAARPIFFEGGDKKVCGKTGSHKPPQFSNILPVSIHAAIEGSPKAGIK
jgi:hypothetical protein